MNKSSAPVAPDLEVRTARSVADLASEWLNLSTSRTPLRPDFLKAVEEARVNGIEPYYLSFFENARCVGCANVYVAETDFATFDQELPESARRTIKAWFPDFMRFKVAECGFFTMIGEGLLSLDESLESCLNGLDVELERIARASGADFLLVRDVPMDKFERYRAMLRPRGYYPVLGFPNSVLGIPWRTLDDYLAALGSKTRLKFRNALKLDEKFGITVKFERDFAPLAPRLAELWRNVNENAKEYSREILDERFFQSCANCLPENSEVLLFLHGGQIIAFMLNLFGDDDYIVLDWGVDYGYEHYRQANLYRAATVLSLQRAIALGKQRLELGITNYTPKMTLGAALVPLVYFVRHIDERRYSKTLARLLSDNITQPDDTGHDSLHRTGAPGVDFAALETRIKTEQNDFPESDVFNRIGAYYRADTMRLAGIYGFRPTFNCAQDSLITFSDGRERVLLGTNSYLGAATHPEVVAAARRAVAEYGTGCSGSPLLNGTLDIHERLEKELADFLGREAVTLCSTGYQTNLAGLSTLCRPGDVVLMDERNHRSLFDGVKLSGADCFVYRHADLGHLERILERTAGRKRLIVSDSLFSMEGVIADLRGICDLARRYGARVFVDESHAIGVLGQNGRGASELLGVERDVDVVMGTFSKSFAALGGFLAGSCEIIDYIKHNAGGHIFSASLPAAMVETVRTVLRLIQKEPERRREILEKAEYMANSLQALDYRAPFHGSQIVPVILGNSTLALAAYRRFMDHGVYVNPVCPPAVPEEAAGFRTSYIATHRWEHLNRALEVFRRHRRDLHV